MARHIVAVMAVVALASCAGGGARNLQPERSWIASTGFPDRGDWPSASLHLSRVEIATVARVSHLLLRDSTLVLGRPWRESWGVHRRLPGDAPGCSLRVMLNGVEMVRNSDDRLINVDALVPTGELDGIEVHHGEESPVWDPLGCGTVLLWSERFTDSQNEPFHGRIDGVVAGEHADMVVEVRLDPAGKTTRPDREGRFEFYGVLPGAYDVVYLGAGGELARRDARVYAYWDTELEWFYPTRGGRSAASHASSMDS